ncbi:MAG: HPr family phosphocarrier protein [Kiritimatiellaeota bacterium]|nr:HPr family phosphocarrier protein [Kiritimatiellota bacterium]
MRKRETLSRTFTLLNKLGLHARPASLLAQLAGKFRSEISVRRGDRVVDGKSILGLMTLGAGQGVSLTVEATGEDAAEALNALDRLFAERFHEE